MQCPRCLHGGFHSVLCSISLLFLIVPGQSELCWLCLCIVYYALLWRIHHPPCRFLLASELQGYSITTSAECKAHLIMDIRSVIRSFARIVGGRTLCTLFPSICPSKFANTLPLDIFHRAGVIVTFYEKKSCLEKYPYNDLMGFFQAIVKSSY